MKFDHNIYLISFVKMSKTILGIGSRVRGRLDFENAEGLPSLSDYLSRLPMHQGH